LAARARKTEERRDTESHTGGEKTLDTRNNDDENGTIEDDDEDKEQRRDGRDKTTTGT
jgi:hypothetical protein